MLRVCLALVLILVVAPVQAATRGMSADDLIRFERISDPQLAPNGKQVAYVLRSTDIEANRGINAIWLQPLDGGTARRLTSLPGSASSPRWSSDGASLYFLSTRSGSSQVWRLDMAGGEARQVTDFELGVNNFRLAPNGKSLALSVEVFVDCADFSCTRKRLDERSTQKASGTVHDKLFVRHWDSWKDGRRNQLFVSALDAEGKAGAARLISRGIDGDVSSKPFGDESDYAWSADSRNLVFSARIAGNSEPWSTNFDLFEVGVEGDAAPRNLTADNPAMDTGPVFSADGKYLYYRAMARAGFEADRLAIMQRDLVKGSTREVAPNWDASATTISLSADGKRLLTTANHIGQHPLFEIEISSGKTRQLVSDGYVAGFSQGGNQLVVVRDSLIAPAQLFAARSDGTGLRRLDQHNAERLAEIAMGAAEQFSFAGWNDETVHGYVVKPWNFEAGKRYPVAFIIHGGPQGSMGDHFHYRWNPQTYAGQGWAVVFIDFHGSTGYGQKFTDSISGDWGGKPLEDLQKGWAAALQRFAFLDADKACALGASYGGYMVNWIAGNWPEPWDCLVSHSGVFDSRMMGYSTEELWFDEWEHGGTPYQVPEAYEKHNPVNHVAKWKTPMLVIHGQLDFRIPVEQSLAAFSALQRQQIQSKFLYFPDENHWILKPANSLQWHAVVNQWLRQHLEPAPNH